MTRAQIETQSALYTLLGANERLLQSTGFKVLRTRNVVEQVAAVSKRWYEFRRRREDLLEQLEGEEQYIGLRKFVCVVYTLSSEGQPFHCLSLR